MTITIDLPPETEARLRAKAEQQGQDFNRYAAAVLAKEAADGEAAAPGPTQPPAEEASSWGDALVSAAEAGDEAAFVGAMRSVDWSRRTAADYEHAVRLALRTGAHLAARHLAEDGSRSHPDDESLSRFAAVLAPPRVLRTDLPPEPSIRLNQDWLRANASQHRGQWVALRGGILLAAAPTLPEVRAQAGKSRDIFVTRIV